MRITESRLRRIIRSVIKESMHDFDSMPPHPDDLELEFGTEEYDSAMSEYERSMDRSRPLTHSTYRNVSDEAQQICIDMLGFEDPECLRIVSSYLKDGNREQAIRAARNFSVKLSTRY